jgi:outer membrane protein, multidrug efflux system
MKLEFLQLRRAPLYLLAGLCACHAPQQRDYNGAPPIELPEDWSASEEDEGPLPSLQDWWQDFGDANLSRTVEEVLENNYDLLAAAARLDAAGAQARIAGAELWPTVGLGMSAGRRRQNFVGFPIPGGNEEVLSSTTTNYGVSLDVAWEIDLWGKLDARAKGAGADYAASAADFSGAQLSLAGQAIKTWLALCEARLQRDLAAERVSSFGTSTEILRERFRNGRVQALDLRLSEVQLARARATLSDFDLNLERVTRELQLLLGEYPSGALEAPAVLPPIPPQLPPGLPSELLQRRPDLVAARERLRANDYYLYAARKELWPTIGLGGSIGRNGEDLADIFDNSFSIWSLVGSIGQPIFQGGRLTANIDLEDAQVRATLADYAQAILRAFLEVETVLAIEDDLIVREEQLSIAAEDATDAEQLAEARYFAGRQDILTYLSARSSSFDNQSALISARRYRLEQRVDLYLALGGGYEDPAAQDDSNGSTSSDEPK